MDFFLRGHTHFSDKKEKTGSGSEKGICYATGFHMETDVPLFAAKFDAIGDCSVNRKSQFATQRFTSQGLRVQFVSYFSVLVREN